MGTFIDLTDMKFNLLTVICLNVGDFHDCTRWDCICDCGGLRTVRGKDLKSGRVRCCGCIKKGKPFIDMTGKKFNKLTVLSLFVGGNNRLTKWNCICDCGNHTVVFGTNLRNGTTKSCGCHQKEMTSKAKKTHGCYALNDRLSGIWEKMKSRCNNPHDIAFHKYGGRGISVCIEWNNSLKTFFTWAIQNGYQDNLTIHRINNNGNYEPSNCMWVTTQVNSQETRRTLGAEKVIEIKKMLQMKVSIRKIAKIYGVMHSTISSIKTGRSYNNIILD